jgi:predicted nucleotidyltransferase
MWIASVKYRPMLSDSIQLSNELRTQISEALKPLRPDKVILFGSYAWGQPTIDSDIDLYVVTQDDFVPSTWRQKRDIVRRISNQILDLRTRYPIDLLVHTRPMHHEFIERRSSFARQIMNEGARLL